MKNCARVFICILFSAVMMTGTAFSVMADSDDEEIERVTIRIEADLTGGGSLDVTTEEEGYSVDSFRFTTTGGFDVGDTPKVKVVLEAADGYQFASNVTKSRVKIEGQGTCTDTSRKSSGRSLEITARLEVVSGTVGEIGNAYWAGSPVGKAKWDAAENANAYEVKLYFNESVVKHVEKTTTTYYDFYSYMTKAGNYHFLVRTVPKNSDEASYMERGEWVLSDELYIESAKTSSSGGSSSSGGTNAPGGSPGSSQNSGPSTAGTPSPNSPFGTSVGWTRTDKGWRYTDLDGTSPVNNWKAIEGKWYFFDLAGYMCTGWQRWNGGYYYLTVNGDMVSGWLEQDRNWYYMGLDGNMMTGWQAVDGNWYYLASNGIMVTGWQLINGKWYYFNPTGGAMAANTSIEGKYVGSDGVWISQ